VRNFPWGRTCRFLFNVVGGIILLSCGGSEIVAPPPPPPPPPPPASVASVTITGAAPTIVVGASVQLTAATLDANGGALSGRAISWMSSDAGVASVSATGTVTGVAVGGPVTITASCDGKSATATISVVAVPVASITVSPAAPSINVGGSVQLTAATLDGAGNPLTGRTVTWSSSNAGIAPVSSTGLVTGLAAGGPVTITATSESKSATASVTVAAIPVASVSVSPSAPTIMAGASVQLTASTLDAAGNALSGRTVDWSSSNPGVATVSGAGLVTGISAGGPVTITATSEGKSGTAVITVAAIVIPVATVNVTPAAPTITVGSSIQLVATTLDADGNTLAGHTITWSSSNESVASVSSDGLVSGLAAGGPVTITATSEGKSGTATVTVAAVVVPVASVAVSPSTKSLIVGATVQLTAVALDASGNALAGRSISWSSSNTGIATVSASGLVTAIAVGGPVTITATSEGKSGTATVDVAPVPVASVTVTPASPTIVIGATVQLTAKTVDADGNTLTGRSVTWSSSNSATASVSGSGLVSGLVVGGPVTITATSEGKSGTASVTIIPVPVASVTVSPSSPSVTVGATLQLTAVTRDANNNVLSGRTVSWSSGNSGIASVSGSGLVTGIVVGGPITITATSEGKSGSASVTIAPVPFNGIATGIKNANAFVTQCPTTDPAYNTIRQDFAFLSDGAADNVAVTCTEPFSTVPVAQLTDELLAIQSLRLIYYMSQGTAGKLPWTTQSLYDWMKSSVAGINFHAQPGLSACCDVIGGKRYIITSRKDAASRDQYRNWNLLSGWVALFVHEARHVSGPGHVNGCPEFPNPSDPLACDATYDLNNLGSYGVQYWLYSGWATGYINVGIGCASTTQAFDNVSWAAGSANIYLTRFVTNPPPAVGTPTPYGGPCLP